MFFLMVPILFILLSYFILTMLTDYTNITTTNTETLPTKLHLNKLKIKSSNTDINLAAGKIVSPTWSYYGESRMFTKKCLAQGSATFLCHFSYS